MRRLAAPPLQVSGYWPNVRLVEVATPQVPAYPIPHHRHHHHGYLDRPGGAEAAASGGAAAAAAARRPPNAFFRLERVDPATYVDEGDGER